MARADAPRVSEAVRASLDRNVLGEMDRSSAADSELPGTETETLYIGEPDLDGDG
jgi:hypothetical protein